MSGPDHDPERQTRLGKLISQADVRNCVNAILAARWQLRELRIEDLQSRYLEIPGTVLMQEFDRRLSEISVRVDELHGLIRQNDLDLPEGATRIASKSTDYWSLGAEEVREPRISILRGELEPIRRLMVAPRLPEAVVLFFLSIPGLRDLLKREIHGDWGYHYHYLDSKERRSDTLLTFEHALRALPGGEQVRVLTWERHSENSHFSARAASWGEKKRESVYTACVSDSAKRSLSDFKKPSKDAETVWPV